MTVCALIGFKNTSFCGLWTVKSRITTVLGGYLCFQSVNRPQRLVLTNPAQPSLHFDGPKVACVTRLSYGYECLTWRALDSAILDHAGSIVSIRIRAASVANVEHEPVDPISNVKLLNSTARLQLLDCHISITLEWFSIVSRNKTHLHPLHTRESIPIPF